MRMNSMLFLLIAFSIFTGISWGDHKKITIEHGDVDLVCELDLVDLRGPKFSVFFQNDEGDVVPYTEELPAARTYIGRVVGNDKFSSAVLAGSLDERGRNFSGVLNMDRGVEHPVEDSKTILKSSRGVSFVPAYDLPTQGTVTPATHQVWAFENAVDVRYSYLKKQKCTDDIPAAIAYIENMAIMNAAVYLRDVKFLPRIGKVVLRTSAAHCPYEGLKESSDLKPALTAAWETLDDGYSQITGFVGGGSSLKGYNVSSFGVIVWRHELCHSIRDQAVPIDHPSNNAEGPTIMSRNIYDWEGHLGRFDGSSTGLMQINRAYTPEDYTDVGVAFKTSPLPPYAAVDHYMVSRKPKGRGKVEMDVLANDFDANDDPFDLVGCDPVSHRGRSVRLGKNSKGRKVAVYDTGPDHIGLDYFFYDIKETAGIARQTARGMVLIDLQNPYRFYPVSSKQITSSDVGEVSTVFSTDETALLFKKREGYVKLTEDVPKKGLYSLKLRYAYAGRGEGVGRLPVVVTVNKGTSRKQVFHRTLGTSFVQHSWQYETIPLVLLERGKNTIYIEPGESKKKSVGLYVDGVMISKGVDIRINFQTEDLASHLGETIHEYFIDTGKKIGEQEANLTYGWNNDITDQAGQTGRDTNDKERDRSGENSWGQLHYNSYIAPSKKDGWRIKLPRGRYNVFMVCGALYGNNEMLIQEVAVKDKNGSETFNTYEQIVEVGSNGALTIRPGPNASDVSISYITINDLN